MKLSEYIAYSCKCPEKKNPKHSFFVEKVTNLSIWDYKSQVLHLSNLANKNTEHPVKFEKLSDELL